jgi:CspA family cold shock protein
MRSVVIPTIIFAAIFSTISTLVSSQIPGLTSDVKGLTALAFLFFITASITSLVVSNKAWSNSLIDETNTAKIDKSRETGTVKWFNTSKGFGFITRDSGDDVFVHFRSIRGQGHRTLIEGQRVEFNITKGEKGLQAEDVAIAS